MKNHFNNVWVILFLCVVAITSFICYNVGKSEVYKAQYNYYEKTEALLDSIYNWDESFMDTVMETDAYYEYEVAKEEIQ